MSWDEHYPCMADGCNDGAVEMVETADDEIVTLCRRHYDICTGPDWTPDTVCGRILMRDTAGSWFFIPERTPMPSNAETTKTITRYTYGDNLDTILSESLSPSGFRKEATARKLARDSGERPVKITVTIEMLPEEGADG